MLNASPITANDIKIQNKFAEHGIGDYANIAPGKPQNLTISCQFGENPLLSWTAPGDNDISHYKVFRKRHNEGVYSYIGITAGTSLTDYNVTMGTSFSENNIFYYVKACDEEGLESDPSNSVNLLSAMSGSSYEDDNKDMHMITAENKIPTKFSLEHNYPNPFNPTTNIVYSIPQAGHVTLQLFDVLGREVATLVNEFKQAGSYNSTFSVLSSPLSSGVYFYQLRCGYFIQTRKMILAK